MTFRVPSVVARAASCFWCGHTPHGRGGLCGRLTTFTKMPCECRGIGAAEEPHCAECGRRIFILADGRVIHRLPSPAELPIGAAGRRWGAEIALFTMATADHEARLAS